MNLNHRRNSLPAACCFVWVAMACAASARSAEAKSPPPPNVVFMLFDDMSFSDPVCYGNIRPRST